MKLVLLVVLLIRVFIFDVVAMYAIPYSCIFMHSHHLLVKLMMVCLMYSYVSLVVLEE